MTRRYPFRHGFSHRCRLLPYHQVLCILRRVIGNSEAVDRLGYLIKPSFAGGHLPAGHFGFLLNLAFSHCQIVPSGPVDV